MHDVVAEIVGSRIPVLKNFRLRREGKLYLALPLSDNSGNVISLNKTAIRILSLCDDCNSINTIARTIAEQCNAEFKTVRYDVIKLSRLLEGVGIVAIDKREGCLQQTSTAHLASTLSL